MLREQTLKKALVVLLVILVALLVLLVATQVNGSSGEVTVTTEPQPMLARVIYRDGEIKRSSKKVTVKQTSSRARLVAEATNRTGPCYVANNTRWGDSGTRDHVVRGTAIFHWCVGKNDPAKIAKYWTNFDYAPNWAQLWKLDWSKVTVDSQIVWTTTWCGSSGVGPCFPVQRKTREYRWQFVRHVPYLDLPQHATFYATCTVRGNAPSVHPNLECYSGWVH